LLFLEQIHAIVTPVLRSSEEQALSILSPNIGPKNRKSGIAAQASVGTSRTILRSSSQEALGRQVPTKGSRQNAGHVRIERGLQ
jgi:hypothetical protein